MTSVVSRTYFDDDVHSGEVIFSDQCSFMLFRADEPSRIYRHHNERYAANCALGHNRFDGDSVILWAGIYHDSRTALMRMPGHHYTRLSRFSTAKQYSWPAGLAASFPIEHLWNILDCKVRRRNPP